MLNHKSSADRSQSLGSFKKKAVSQIPKLVSPSEKQAALAQIRKRPEAKSLKSLNDKSTGDNASLEAARPVRPPAGSGDDHLSHKKVVVDRWAKKSIKRIVPKKPATREVEKPKVVPKVAPEVAPVSENPKCANEEVKDDSGIVEEIKYIIEAQNAILEDITLNSVVVQEEASKDSTTTLKEITDETESVQEIPELTQSADNLIKTEEDCDSEANIERSTPTEEEDSAAMIPQHQSAEPVIEIESKDQILEEMCPSRSTMTSADTTTFIETQSTLHEQTSDSETQRTEEEDSASTVIERNQRDDIGSDADVAEEYYMASTKSVSVMSVEEVQYNDVEYYPDDNDNILTELQEADQQAYKTVNMVEQLKRRINELQNKEVMTDEDNIHLQTINAQLSSQLHELEKITAKVQRLVGTAESCSTVRHDINALNPPSVPSAATMDTLTSTSSEKYEEDSLPKVIICAPASDSKPSIILCETIKKEKVLPSEIIYEQPKQDMPVIKRQLRESYNMQDKLAADNVDLETEKYRLQEELFKKDQMCDVLQRKISAMENEMRLISKENTSLSEKLAVLNNVGDNIYQTKYCGVCPADVEYRLQQYKNSTNALDSHLAEMRNEVCCLKMELSQVHKERVQLDSMLKSKGPCAKPAQTTKETIELRNLKENYQRLQEDYKAKITEMMKQNEELSKALNDERYGFKQNVNSLIENERLLSGTVKGSKDQLTEYEQQLNVLKQQHGAVKEEVDELRQTIQEQTTQLEEYRNKYLTAQQMVEEQKHQLEFLNLDNSRISDQINLEVQRVRSTFQDKMRKLSPLPYILEDTQLKLADAIKAKQVAESSADAIAREFEHFKEKAQEMARNMERVKNSEKLTYEMNITQLADLSAMKSQFYLMQKENEALKAAAKRTAQNEQKLKATLRETMQLGLTLENVRNESARIIARAKQRNEISKKAMQSHISELETTLTQSRAIANVAVKERDELKQKMQLQIDMLTTDYEDAKIKLQSLQGQFSYMKTSLSKDFEPVDCSSLTKTT